MPHGGTHAEERIPFSGLTGTTVQAQGEQARNEEIERQKCLDQGGTWDAELKTCTLPTPPPSEADVREKQLFGSVGGQPLQAEPTPPAPSGSVVTDAETGEVTGFINTAGNFVKSNRADVQSVVAKQQARTAVPAGATTVQQFQTQQRVKQSLSKLGVIQGVVGKEQELDISEAITAGTVGSAADIVQSAAIGFTAGALAGGVATPLAVATGLIGAAVGVWRGVQGNIESQQKGQIGANIERYNTALRGMRTLAMLATTYPDAAPQLVDDFNTQKFLMHQAYADVKAETDEDLEKYIEDGTEILAKMASVLDPDTGLLNIYELRLILAVEQGVPMDDLALALEAAQINLE